MLGFMLHINSFFIGQIVKHGTVVSTLRRPREEGAIEPKSLRKFWTTEWSPVYERKKEKIWEATKSAF